MSWLEHRVPPPVIGLAAAALMWGLARLAPSMHFPFTGHVALAFATGVVGLLVDVAGILQFRRARTTVNPMRLEAVSALVTTGIFRWTRNPMYLGFAIVLVAWAMYLANPLSLLGIALFIAYLNRFQIAPEERVLERHFGVDFLQYRTDVRRWL